MKASRKKQIILEKLYSSDEKEPSNADLEELFPNLYSKSSLKEITKRGIILNIN